MIRLLGAIAMLVVLAASGAAPADKKRTKRMPTAAEYVAHIKGSRLVAPGDFEMAGHKLRCGANSTVIDNRLNDYAAAYPGFPIMNVRLLVKISTRTKLWIFARQCEQSLKDMNSETADCRGIQRGKRQGWLDSQGLKKICEFIAPAKGDAKHASGKVRCAAMLKCFKAR